MLLSLKNSCWRYDDDLRENQQETAGNPGLYKNEILTKGYPPAVREICEAVQLKSTSSVHAHLASLERNGYIRRDSTKPRAIEILDDNFNAARSEMVSVPIVGRVAAGEPILAEENIESYFPIPAERMPRSDAFILEVHGKV